MQRRDVDRARADNDAVVRKAASPAAPPTSTAPGTAGLDAVHASADGHDQAR